MIESRTMGVWVDESATRRPLPALWRQLALLSLTFALLDGFGAYAQLFALTPMKYVAVQGALLVATLIVCPVGAMTRVFLPVTALLMIGWWMLSYGWDANQAAWISTTSRDLMVIVTVVLLAQLLGRDDFVRCLLRSGYAAIALIFFTLVVQPTLAYERGGTSPGLHGGFTHKNLMAPCLLLTAAVVIATHPNRLFRRWFVAFIALLLFLGQTTTGLATLAAMLLVNWTLTSYKDVVRRLGRAAGTLLVGAAMIATLIAATTFSSLVMLSGKDLTFSSRTVIWDGVNAAIGQRFWRGYGYAVWNNLWVDPIRSINQRNGFIVAHAHNAALDLMLRLGLIGLVLFVVQLLSTVRAGWRGLMGGDTLGRLTLLYCALVVLFGFSESLPAFGVWAALLIAFAAVSRTPSGAAAGDAP